MGIGRSVGIPEEHKRLLKQLGLTEKDFEIFDGKRVTYEFDPEKGVRIHDPYCLTSYPEYIDVEGWSSWSSEGDTFQKDILKKAWAVLRRREREITKPSLEEIADTIRKKFDRKDEPTQK